MGPARIYPWRKMHQSRAPSIAPGTFIVAQPWADCITNMPGSDLRQAQPGVRLVLEADDNVISIPHEDHVARGLVPSPALGPEVEHVMQVDVGEQRRDYRSLPRSLFTDRDNPVLQDTRLQPLLDQAANAPI